MQVRDIENLRLWFLEEQRDLPWRFPEDTPQHGIDPYLVWISEIMLQQTQVSVVIPYFERWMERFPTIQELAKSSLEEVMKMWEGLGYYSRVRNIHKAAALIVTEYGGRFPAEREAIQALPGLGPYTTGALLAFAFRQKAAAIDGNVLRVIARLFAIEEAIDKNVGKKKVEAKALALLPDEKPWQITEALIELGAKVCQKQPRCSSCPIATACAARQQGMAAKLPVKAIKKTYEALSRAVWLIEHEGAFLVQQEKRAQVMQGLFEFPYSEGENSPGQVQEKIIGQWPLTLSWIGHLPQVSHSFTRYRVLLTPFLFQAAERKSIPHHCWLTLDELSQRPFSSGHRRLLEMLRQR
ncbi:MAG: mutY [Chlamydiales bacterium]|jgi:A/G-specific adenine glycosylase|nr:mutY [Chlamydiales bacterium]